MRRAIPYPRSDAAVRFLAPALCLASGLLAGCSSSEPRTERPRAPADEPSASSPGKALLYVIRGDEGADRMEVKLTADLLGTIASRDYIAAEVEPGNYVLGCFLTFLDRDPVHTFSTVRLAGGRAQYFRVEKLVNPPRPGAFAEEIAILVEELDEAEGERLLPSLRRVTLAEEPPPSIPFHGEVAVADDPEPAAETSRESVATPAPVEIAKAREISPPPTADVGGEAESVAEPVAADPVPGPETGIVAGRVLGREAEEAPDSASAEAELPEPEAPVTDSLEIEALAVEAPDTPEETRDWARAVTEESQPATRPSPVKLSPIKLYKGPRLARSRTAHLVMGDRVFVAAVNGIEHDVGPFGSDLAGVRLPRDAFRTGGVELKPGRYRIELAWHGPSITRKRTYFGTHELDVELEAGATYTVSGAKDGEDVLGWKPKVAKAPRDPSN